MIRRTSAGTALRLLCLPFALLVLASCQRQQTSQPPAVQTFHAAGPDGGQQESDALIAATKQHPSLQPGSNEAGAPITVDPYPHSAGMSDHAHNAHHVSAPAADAKPKQ